MNYLMLPLIGIDVAGNVLLAAVSSVVSLDPSIVKDSWKHTLSAKAGSEQAKGQPYFSWVAPTIDKVFGPGHCARQYSKEQIHGSVWAAWYSE